MSFKEFIGGDYTPLEHAAYALLMGCAVVIGTFLFTGDISVLAAVLFPTGFFLGREHAQAEAKIKKKQPELALPEFAAFAIWKWNWGSQMDFYAPFAAVLVTGWLAGLFV